MTIKFSLSYKLNKKNYIIIDFNVCEYVCVYMGQ